MSGLPIPDRYGCYQITAIGDLPVGVPFSLTCARCDCDAPDTYMQAVLEGWTNIFYDPTGPSWNFVGDCPECERRSACQD